MTSDHPSTRNPARRRSPTPSALSRPAHSPPRRTNRVTRSQSRDISDNDNNQAGERQPRGKPKNRNAIDGREAAVSSRQPTKKAQPTGSKRTLQDLKEVDESPNVNYPELPQAKHEEEAGQNRNTDHARRVSDQTIHSIGAISGFSGTTVRNSRSGLGLSVGSAEDMIHTLEDLSDASDKILRLLLFRDISETSIQGIKALFSNPTSRERKQLENYNSIFQGYRNVYGEAMLIDVPAIARRLLGLPKQESLRSGPWRMDPILYKANMTVTARDLIAQVNDNIEKSIEDLDEEFPQPFFHQLVDEINVQETVDSSAQRIGTYLLALDIRTQYFIDSAKRLIDEPNFDPDSLLQQVFYREGNMLNGWHALGMRSEDLIQDPELRNSVLNRLDLLRQSFSLTEPPFINLASLERDFPRDRLLANLGRWSQLRLGEIVSQLRGLGGAEGIVGALQNVSDHHDRVTVDSRPDHNRVTQTAASASAAMPPPDFSLNSPKALPATVARLKEREAMRRASRDQQQLRKQFATPTTIPTTTMSQIAVAAAPPTRVQTKNVLLSHEPPPWQPAQIEDEEAPNLAESDIVTNVRNIMHTQDEINAESNKENVAIGARSQPPPSSQLNSHREAATKNKELIDAQPGSRRIAFDSQEPKSSIPSNPPQSSIQESREETRQSLSDVSEDEGFQQDNRQLPEPKRRRVASREHGAAVDERLPTGKAGNNWGGQGSAEEGDLHDALERHHAANDPPVPSQVDMYRVANSSAKLRVAKQPKRPQTRVPWSEEEIDRLQELIEEYGLSWSLLKQQDGNHKDGPVLYNRDQVSLKDKARNMKMDYLK
ncbi:MAG: hypothetical protein Q9209_002640 [Squamulea sp. 1 TL-2023]